MTHDEHHLRLGQILNNLLSLECMARACSLEHSRAPHPELKGLRAGDQVALTPVTDDLQLRAVLTRYNAIPGAETIDVEPIAALRDALAHGRILAEEQATDMTLYKFGREKQGPVTVIRVDVMDDRWFTDNIRLTGNAGMAAQRTYRKLTGS